MDYGEIRNVNTAKTENRIGDLGIDKDSNTFAFTRNGWFPLDPQKYDALYWKKKYLDLLESIQPKENDGHNFVHEPTGIRSFSPSDLFKKVDDHLGYLR